MTAKSRVSQLTSVAAGLSLTLLSSSAMAVSTWSMNGSAGTDCGITGTTYGNYSQCTNNGVTVEMTAWSNTATTPSGGFESARLMEWTGGLGVRNRNLYDAPGDGNTTPQENETPEHSIDNLTNTDMVVLKFSESVILNALTLGWFQTDSDVSILRYSGATSAATTASSLMTGKTVGDLVAAGGWQLLTNIADVPVNSSKSFNAGGESSSWWLISAYNSSFGGTSLTNGNDFFKLLAFAADKPTTPPGGNVPEPSTIALAGLALLGLVRARAKAHRRS